MEWNISGIRLEIDGSHGQMASLGYPTVSDQPKYGFITNKQNIAREGLRKKHQSTTLKRGCIEMQAIHMTHMTINGFV